MDNYFKKTAIGLITSTLITASFSNVWHASENSQANLNQKTNETNTTVFEGRFPTMSELKNAKGNIIVLPNDSEPQTTSMLRQSNSPISNAKRYTKTYSLDTIAAGGGSATTLVGFIRQSLGKSVKLGPLAAVTMTAGGMRAAGYKSLVVHVYSYEISIDPETGAPLKKKQKITQIEKYELKK